MKDERNWRDRYQVTADIDKENKKKKKTNNSEVNALITAVLCGLFLAIMFIIYLMYK